MFLQAYITMEQLESLQTQARQAVLMMGGAPTEGEATQAHMQQIEADGTQALQVYNGYHIL